MHIVYAHSYNTIKTQINMLIDNIRDYNLIDGVDTQTTAKTLCSLMGKDCNREGNLDVVTGFFSIKGLNFIQEIMADGTRFRFILSKIVGYGADDDNYRTPI